MSSCAVGLCHETGIADVPVATRPAGPGSHSGLYESYFYVKGGPLVIRNITKVWSSTFSQRPLIARATGVMFTINPVNGDPSKIMIDGNWGLGESVVSGSVCPDEWVVDKVLMKINKAMISSKLKEFVFDKKTEETIFVDIPPDRQNCPCLSEEEVLELARTGKRVEKHYGSAQDTEWAIDNDLPFPENVFMLQCRPEQVWNKKKAEPIAKTGFSFIEYMSDRFIEGW